MSASEAFTSMLASIVIFAAVSNSVCLAGEDVNIKPYLDKLERFDHREGVGPKITPDEERLLFPASKTRIGVVSYDTNSNVLRGDDVAFILSKQILFNSSSRNVSVLNFRNNNEATKYSDQYYDLVEKLTRGQRVSLSIWGKIIEQGETLTVDTYLQLAPQSSYNTDPSIQDLGIGIPFEAALGGNLHASVRPARLRVQSIVFRKGEAERLAEVAEAIHTLRASPSKTARVVGRLLSDRPFTIIASKGDWVRLDVDGGLRGWTSVQAYCNEVACKKLLDSADFINVLTAIERRSAVRLRSSLTPETDVFRDQVACLSYLQRRDFVAAARTAGRHLLDESAIRNLSAASVMSPSRLQELLDQASEHATSPSKVNFANMFAISIVNMAENDVNEIKFYRRIAEFLTKASLFDPSNLDIIRNIERLYLVINDRDNAKFAFAARELALRFGTPKEKTMLAFVVDGQSDFWKLAEAGVKKAQAELPEYDLLFRYPDQASGAVQQRLMEDLVETGASAIMVSAVAPKASTPNLNRIGAQVPLFTTDSDAPDSNRVAYIGSSNFDAGKQAGEIARKAMPYGGKCIGFVGLPAADNARERIEGMKTAIANSKVELIDVRGDEIDLLRAKRNVEEALATNPDVDCMVGFYSYNPPLIYETVKRKGKLGKITIIAFDDDPVTLAGVKEGSIAATVVHQPYEWGYQGMKLMAKYLQGDKSVVPADRLLIVPTKIIDKSNVETFIAERNARISSQ